MTSFRHTVGLGSSKLCATIESGMTRFFEITKKRTFKNLQINPDLTIQSIRVELKPTFIPAIMTESGNQPPWFVENKSIYIVKDLERLAHYYQIPLNPIADPVTTLLKKVNID